jgi:hypothetical protein
MKTRTPLLVAARAFAVACKADSPAETAGASVTYQPAPGVAPAIKGEPVTGWVVLEGEGEPPGGEMLLGDVRLVIHLSGERLSLRVRDPNRPLAKDFRGFTWFPIDPAYRVVGKFVRDAEPKKMQVMNTFNDLDTYTTEGRCAAQIAARAGGSTRQPPAPAAIVIQPTPRVDSSVLISNLLLHGSVQ